MGLGDDVRRTFAKFYINYSARKSFTTVQVGRSVIKIYISASPDGLDAEIFRDVRSIGHYGMGDASD
jgi:predicted transport protein